MSNLEILGAQKSGHSKMKVYQATTTTTQPLWIVFYITVLYMLFNLGLKTELVMVSVGINYRLS